MTKVRLFRTPRTVRLDRAPHLFYDGLSSSERRREAKHSFWKAPSWLLLSSFLAPQTVRNGEVSLVRLYVMRLMYLAIALGIGAMVLPTLLNHSPETEGLVTCLLGGMGLLAILGLRYPLQMVPLLMFEFVWKTMWVLDFGLPKLLSHQLVGDFAADFKGTMVGVVLMPPLFVGVCMATFCSTRRRPMEIKSFSLPRRDRGKYLLRRFSPHCVPGNDPVALGTELSIPTRHITPALGTLAGSFPSPRLGAFRL